MMVLLPVSRFLPPSLGVFKLSGASPRDTPFFVPGENMPETTYVLERIDHLIYCIFITFTKYRITRFIRSPILASGCVVGLPRVSMIPAFSVPRQ